ncbi:PepSY domain-containing protein [Zhongshania aliphaticivorans]|uniref:PepSY domain-containing protein n=1 Tax=Zhongshania aliphaticivorans TaxID=1470434 RepID=UPI0012E61AA5|nr:PepSY domain-containing protein [Zhongshania aliphaticivorans]CAA0119468.1 Uncharacterised protein [Zhongshania aliphaticivorans]
MRNVIHDSKKVLKWKWWKRQLFLLHRWLGVILCLFFCAWFISGIFMMYVEYPNLTLSERFAGQQTLDFSSSKYSAADAVAQLSAEDYQCVATPSETRCEAAADPKAPVIASKIRLAMLFGRPVYYIHIVGSDQVRAVYADTGERVNRIQPDLAARIASEFFARGSGKAITARYIGNPQTDQWTLSSSLNAHRPLLHFAFNDSQHTELYVSSTTGEVVRDSHRIERVLNYFSAVTHWLYPTVLRKFPDLWAWAVDILSTAGVVLSFTGLWMGWLRWKRKPKPGKPSIPYRGIMRWHYITGVLFGTVTLLWIFSGLLSMNPGKLNPSRSASIWQQQQFTGVTRELVPEDFSAIAPNFPNSVVSVELIHFDTQAVYQAWQRDGRVVRLNSNGEVLPAPELSRLKTMASTLRPNETVTRYTILEQYDSYYFTRHPERGGKPLPILRVEYSDADRTWFHINLVTGELLDKSTTVNRLYRWLYNGLHSWDYIWLWERRPLWDIVVISLSLGGLSLSILGVVVGWRRLKHSIRI